MRATAGGNDVKSSDKRQADTVTVPDAAPGNLGDVEDAVRRGDRLGHPRSTARRRSQAVGAIAHSLAQKEVLYFAALDERVRVAVRSEGGIGTSFSNSSDPWYLGDAIRRPDFHHETMNYWRWWLPRAFLLLGGDSANGDRSWPFIEAVLPVWRLYGGPSRVGLVNHRKGHSVPSEA